jgi:type III restriction enzyme
MSSMELREIENAKIACARKFFSEIGQHDASQGVKYEVVTDYGKLMELVGVTK